MWLLGRVGLIQVLGAMQTIQACVLLATAAMLASCAPSPAHTDRVHCETIHPGMSEAQVDAVMGPPTNRKELPMSIVKVRTVSLSFGEQFGASGPVSVWLEDNGQGYIVTETMCDGGA